MSEVLIRAATDWIPVFRARIIELGLACSEVDHLAQLPTGYTNKLLNGRKGRPGAVTIERLCGALALAFKPEVDAEREALMRPRWMKRRR